MFTGLAVVQVIVSLRIEVILVRGLGGNLHVTSVGLRVVMG
jgi:hypothetical protein